VLFHDNTSLSQSENLDTITSWHNRQNRDYDVSVHFNCYDSSANGTEVLYVTQEGLAGRLSDAISVAGNFINRGAKYRSDLAFLNSTTEPAVLIETCFCDNTGDCQRFETYFENICRRIAETLSERTIDELPEQPPERPEDLPPIPSDALLRVRGLCSWFGGPDDTGVDEDEGLAFLYQVHDAPHLFLPQQPSGTTGLARRLDPDTFYVACRWNYDRTPKDMLRNQSLKALVRARGQEFLAYPADWGPHEDTGRVADLSPALMEALDLSTDDEVEVIYPAP
jgi:hypothetical protein